MNANTKFEIMAGAFLIMTGRMAPGKDSPTAMGTENRGELQLMWEEWHRKYRPVIDAVLKSVEMNAPELIE